MKSIPKTLAAVGGLSLAFVSGCADDPVERGTFDVTEEERDTAVDPVAEFLEAHEVATELTRVYCRLDVATPDCRSVLRYRALDGGALVESFRITFSSPVAQSGGTELFLKTGETSFARFTDATVDGEPSFERAGEVEALVDASEPDDDALGTTVTIYDITFGPLTADLVFGDGEALLEGEIASDDGDQPFSRSYPRLVPQATPPSDAPSE